MAISFPNFLGQIQKPDYSGVGDVFENYYKGKAMPQDALIKQIQAEFARPNAETDLANAKTSGANAKLSGEHVALQIQQLRQQLQEQAQMEAAIRQAMGQGGDQPAMPSPNAMSGALGNQQGSLRPDAPVTDPQIFKDHYFDPAKMDRRFNKFDPLVGGSTNPSNPNASPTLHGLPRNVFHGGNEMQQLAPMIAQSMQPQQPPAAQPSTLAPAGEPIKLNGVVPDQTPAMLQAPQSSENETILSKGSPNLYGIDSLYEQNPQAREYLKKKGFDKKVETKVDAKTGTTRIITTYPSGKTSMITSAPLTPASEGIPLTSAMITQHQKVITGVDNAIPDLQELRDLKSYPHLPGYHGSEYADYNSLVKSALDSVMNAFGMPKTNEGIASIKEQIERDTFETDAHYKKKIEKLMTKLEARKNYAANEVKRSNKISPINSSNEGNEAESMSDSELEAIANG